MYINIQCIFQADISTNTSLNNLLSGDCWFVGGDDLTGTLHDL